MRSRCSALITPSDSSRSAMDFWGWWAFLPADLATSVGLARPMCTAQTANSTSCCESSPANRVPQTETQRQKDQQQK
jgi:hypothetical protein